MADFTIAVTREDFVKGLQQVKKLQAMADTGQIDDSAIDWSDCCGVAQASVREGDTRAVVQRYPLISVFKHLDGTESEFRIAEPDDDHLALFDTLARLVSDGLLDPDNEADLTRALTGVDFPLTVRFFD